MEQAAQRILDAVERIDAETRYEEKLYFDRGVRIASTNEMLRVALGAPTGQARYPTCADLCDVACSIDGERVWLEVKHSWTWLRRVNPAVANGLRRKHLLGNHEQSALDDALVKLPRLVGQPGVDLIGLLVVALDSTQIRYPLSDIDTLAQTARMNAEPWQRFTRPRWASKVPGYESIGVQPFLWLRPASVVVASRPGEARL